MAFSSLSKLQLIRSIMLVLAHLDVIVTTFLFLRLGSGASIRDTFVDQVSCIV